MSAPFMPKRMQQWKPEHMKGPPRRRCHWCTSGPHRLNKLGLVLELPMRYYFCGDECVELWRNNRHKYVSWFALGMGTRANILKRRKCATGSKSSRPLCCSSQPSSPGAAHAADSTAAT